MNSSLTALIFSTSSIFSCVISPSIYYPSISLRLKGAVGQPPLHPFYFNHLIFAIFLFPYLNVWHILTFSFLFIHLFILLIHPLLPSFLLLYPSVYSTPSILSYISFSFQLSFSVSFALLDFCRGKECLREQDKLKLKYVYGDVVKNYKPIALSPFKVSPLLQLEQWKVLILHISGLFREGFSFWKKDRKSLWILGREMLTIDYQRSETQTQPKWLKPKRWINNLGKFPINSNQEKCNTLNVSSLLHPQILVRHSEVPFIPLEQRENVKEAMTRVPQVHIAWQGQGWDKGMKACFHQTPPRADWRDRGKGPRREMIQYTKRVLCHFRPQTGVNLPG